MVVPPGFVEYPPGSGQLVTQGVYDGTVSSSAQPLSEAAAIALYKQIGWLKLGSDGQWNWSGPGTVPKPTMPATGPGVTNVQPGTGLAPGAWEAITQKVQSKVEPRPQPLAPTGSKAVKRQAMAPSTSRGAVPGRSSLVIPIASAIRASGLSIPKE